MPNPQTQQAGLAVAAIDEGEMNICGAYGEESNNSSAYPTSSHQTEAISLLLPGSSSLGWPWLWHLLLPEFNLLYLGTSTRYLHSREAWSCLSAGHLGTASPGQLCPGTLQKLPLQTDPCPGRKPKGHSSQFRAASPAITYLSQADKLEGCDLFLSPLH